MLSEDDRSMPTPGKSNGDLGDDVNEDEPADESNKDGKKNWKLLKDKLKQQKARAGSAWTPATVPASDIPLNLNKRSPSSETHLMAVGDFRSRSAMFQRNASRRAVDRGLSASSRFNRDAVNIGQVDDLQPADRGSASSRFHHDVVNLGQAEAAKEEEEAADEDEEGESPDAEAGGGDGEEKKVRMSLMALLAETDKEMGLDGATYMMGDDDEDDDEDDMAGRGGREEYSSSCCVCMVKHKGVASSPCGHTFCKLCSKEMQVSKGNCPLCNSFILEILDIF